MHSFLKAVGFSKVTKREEMKEIILDVIKNYDEKNVVEVSFPQASPVGRLPGSMQMRASIQYPPHLRWDIHDTPVFLYPGPYTPL